MRSLIALFLEVIFIVSLINCKTVEPTDVKKDVWTSAELTESVTELLLSLSSEEYQKKVVEIVMTHHI